MKNTVILFIALLTLPFVAQAQNTDFDGTGIVAHCGFWNCEEAGYSKNSIASLRCAQEAGLWGSEFDVNMTEMLNLKVNMLTTDQPLQARELMKEMNIKEL